jgi:putative flavoprotein involved in K+ transport
MKHYDVVVIGGGQSGLSVGYYLRRTGLSYVILDNQGEGGGAWLQTWESLKLFSPAQWSSLPGMIMAGGSDHYPTRDATIEYLRSYETKYNLPVQRGVNVLDLRKQDDEFLIETSDGLYRAKAVVSATGTFANPFIPEVAGRELFKGQLIHSSQYKNPEKFIGKRVAIVGEGNSGAQILAEISKVAETIWVTQKEPRFLPDHVDGRFLFDAATQLYEAQKAGKQYKPPSLGDVVMVDSVKYARDRHVLKSRRPFHHFTEDSIVWADGPSEKIDAVVFCTGFKAALNHLDSLEIIGADGRVETNGTRSTRMNGLWLVGYGQWTGFASSTLIGVGRSAKTTADQISQYISAMKESQPS